MHTGQKELDERVVAARYCTGCGACVNLCPYRKAYKDRIVSLFGCDIEEGRCYAFCPRTPVDLEALRREMFDPEDLTVELGAVKAVYIARASRARVREKAQHGGTVSTLMSLALKEGMIDGAVMTTKGHGLEPSGVVETQAGGVIAHAGSTFVVSPSVAEFNRAAGKGFRALGAVALPCQALAYARMRVHQAAGSNLPAEAPALVIGLFCSWALSLDRFQPLVSSRTDASKVSGMEIPPKEYGVMQVFTWEGTLQIPLDEVKRCIRGACHYCFDLTGEFSDVSVGTALLEEDWRSACSWNTVIVRTDRGRELLDLARRRRLLEFREPTAGVEAELKLASMGKKEKAVHNLRLRSGRLDDLVYLDAKDPAFKGIS